MASNPTPAPIDPRGPRTNQAVLASALVLGFVLGIPWVAPVFAVVLFLGAAFGPKWGPVLRAYQLLLRPRLAPPKELEDPRPPRFAAAVGVAFLSAASLAFALGAPAVGWSLALIVAALAALAATTGLCVGCEMYVWFVRLRGGVRIVTVDRDERAGHGARSAQRGDLPDLPGEHLTGKPVWVVFTTEYCAVCPKVVADIQARRPDDSVVVLDVSEHLDLAARYRVRRAPTVLRADAEGHITTRLSGADAVRSEVDESVAGAGAIV